MWSQLEEYALHLANITGLRIVTVDTTLPSMGAAWSISGMIEIQMQLADHWPQCADVLTPEMRFGLEATAGKYGAEARAKIESRRAALNQRMSEIFSAADFVITASNPDVAFAAEGPLPSEFGGVQAGMGNNGKLTFPANMHGNPAISIPAGLVDGLPIALQVNGPHYSEQLLLELGLAMERSRPWALVAPGSPK
jgi:aspartyl-tRNA(Asn)/glutamyl-tRNA(Gln) amidotransferase subunit A